MIVDSRLGRVKLNIIIAFATQMVYFVCRLLIPNLMIRTFGSAAYGATTSIAQFLSYITLLEGGIGGVARAVLYKPLANNDWQRISAIVAEMKHFFRIIAGIFVVYTMVLACFYKYIAKGNDFEWLFTFSLVIAISISTFAQYFIGISYSTLINASQRLYIVNTITSFTMILNTVFTIILIHLNCNIVVVKLASSIIFLLQPLFMWFYVRKNYKLVKCDVKKSNYLSQKWDGLGQHLAYFFHFQTDIVILTIFTNLSLVAVYSVYNMIISYMQSITASFAAGMEALFGEMLAKEEYESLNNSFNFYEMMLSVITVILFSVAAVMIVPFVKIYTAGVTDANYIQPLFAVILLLASVLYCLRLPYHELTIAAGHFKQTNKAAYGEAAINVTLSILLLRPFGLCGIATATVVATGFRFLYYVFYLSKNIICRGKRLFLKRQLVNAMCFVGVLLCGTKILQYAETTNYFYWVFYAAIITVMASVIVLIVNLLFYKEMLLSVLGKVFKKAVRR